MLACLVERFGGSDELSDGGEWATLLGDEQSDGLETVGGAAHVSGVSEDEQRLAEVVRRSFELLSLDGDEGAVP